MAQRKKTSADEISPAKTAKIRSDIASWAPGRWAEEVAYRPSCICGLHRDRHHTCRRHPERNPA